MKKIKQMLKKQGFTLVELIIVIAIIAVLAVAAFMMLTKWLGKSRDSRRLGDLATIASGLQVGYSDTDDGINMYPSVKDQTGSIVLMSGADTIVGYQGVADNEVVVGASMQKAPTDPSDGSYYTYLVSQNRQKFQLLAFLEDGSEVSLLNDAYALEYANMTPTTKGFDLGVILRQSDNMPANLIGGTLTGVDLADSEEFKAVVNGSNILLGTGMVDAPIVKENLFLKEKSEQESEMVTIPCPSGINWGGRTWENDANCEYIDGYYVFWPKNDIAFSLTYNGTTRYIEDVVNESDRQNICSALLGKSFISTYSTGCYIKTDGIGSSDDRNGYVQAAITNSCDSYVTRDQGILGSPCGGNCQWEEGSILKNTSEISSQTYRTYEVICKDLDA